MYLIMFYLCIYIYIYVYIYIYILIDFYIYIYKLNSMLSLTCYYNRLQKFANPNIKYKPCFSGVQRRTSHRRICSYRREHLVPTVGRQICRCRSRRRRHEPMRRVVSALQTNLCPGAKWVAINNVL